MLSIFHNHQYMLYIFSPYSFQHACSFRIHESSILMQWDINEITLGMPKNRAMQNN